MKLVYTDLMGPIKPAAQGGFEHTITFTDEFSKVKEEFDVKTESDAPK